jgi:hypothetical protein
MKSSPSTISNLLIVTAVAGLVASQTSQAADITWAAPASTTSFNDIITEGTLVEAGNWSNNTSTLDVTVGSETISFVQMTQSSFSPAASGVQYNTGLYDGTTGDATFDAIMDSNAWTGSGPSSRTFTLSGLVDTQEYMVQFFASDDRNATTQASTITFSAGNTSAVATYGDSPYVIGTFTADATTQDITIAVSSQLAMSAYVLRAIPEPGTYALFAGLTGLTFVMLRRRG